ncbi:MAG: sensor histidine kinase [Bernardetiaceae bacterium]
MPTRQKIPPKVYRLTVFMVFGLLGLITIQVYWVINAIQENRQSFQQNVHKALNTIVSQLERREGMELMRERFREQLTQDALFVHYFDSIYAQGDTTHYMHERQLPFNPAEDQQLLIQPIPPPDPSLTREEHLRRYLEKAVSYSTIFNEMAQKERPIEERLSRQQLDSVIKEELHNVGIHTPCNFAVLNIRHEKILFSNDLRQQVKMLKSGFYHQLFPNDFRRSENYLYLHFPNEQQYLLGNMWFILLSSLLFLGLMVISFWLSVRVILQQKALTEATTDFVNNMTHEFRTPIATIKLATEMLRQIPQQNQRYITMISDETERLSRQVEKVLQAARMERGDLQMNMELVDMHEIIESAIQNISLHIEQRQGTFRQKLAAKQTRIEGDFLHLSNILSGLLDNANKYSPSRPEIAIETYNVKKGICINIFDKGKGISKADIAKVFDRFYRVPTGDVHDVKGFGLGLSYVKTVVDAHQGQITVKSELGKGSCFTIFLPFAQH